MRSFDMLCIFTVFGEELTLNSLHIFVCSTGRIVSFDSANSMAFVIVYKWDGPNSLITFIINVDEDGSFHGEYIREPTDADEEVERTTIGGTYESPQLIIQNVNNKVVPGIGMLLTCTNNSTDCPRVYRYELYGMLNDDERYNAVLSTMDGPISASHLPVVMRGRTFMCKTYDK